MPSFARRQVPGLLAVPLVLMLGAPGVAGPTVERDTVAPSGTDVRYAVSPTGVRVASVQRSGLGEQVVVDGTAEPAFDEILETGRTLTRTIDVSRVTRHVVFSDDGAHHAYVARRGEAFVVMKDGSELWASPGRSVDRLQFAPGTARLTWRFDRGGDPTVPPTTLVVDGTPGVFGFGLDGIALSPAGGRTAYTIQDPDGGDGRVVVVDGAVHHRGSAPRWLGDGSAVLSQRAGANGSREIAVLLDGEPVVESTRTPEVATHAGSASWAVTWRPADAHHDHLMVNGTSYGAYSAAEIVWSEDGSRFAAVQRVVGDHTVMVDGERGPAFDDISQRPVFTPDGSRVAWVGRNRGRDVIVLDDQMFDGHRSTSWIGFHGTQLGYRVLLDGGGHAVFRGDEGFGPLPRLTDMAFSEDGRRLAIRYTPPGAMMDAPMVDGTIYGDLRVRSAFAFSPDGASLAFVASTRRSDDERLLWLDGSATPLPRGVVVSDFTWLEGSTTPAFVTAKRTGVGRVERTLWLDGAPTDVVWSDEDDGWRDLVAHDAWWELGADGRLRFLVPGVGGIDRITVTPIGAGFATVPAADRP